MDILLFNPNAGTAKKMGLTTDDLVEKLHSQGIEVTTPNCETEEEIAAVLADSPERVIVAGGDGTVHSLLQAAAACNVVKVGIIPIGTANHLANTLNIPQDVDAAIQVISEGFTKQIDLGKINGTVFSQAAGAGFHAKIFHAYGDHKDKSSLDAAKAAISTLADWTPQLMRVIIDGKPYIDAVTQITAANTPMYGAKFMIAPDARIDDGLLDVVILGNLSKAEIIEYGWAALSGNHVNLEKTYVTQAKRIEIDAIGLDPVEVHADAEPVGYTPKVIEVLPGCLEITVPREKETD